jgi:hypothetical protein
MAIIDYKTSRMTGAQSYLSAMYRVQLNAYAFLAVQTGYMGEVKKTALVYIQPPAKEEIEASCEADDKGILVRFKAKTELVEVIMRRRYRRCFGRRGPFMT